VRAITVVSRLFPQPGGRDTTCLPLASAAMSSSEEQFRDVFDRLTPEIQRALLDRRRSGRVSAEVKAAIERAGGPVGEWWFPEGEPGSDVYALHPDFAAFLDTVAERKGYDLPPLE
jgi:hypothetical protein